MPASVEQVGANLERVRERIARAAERAGRQAEEITLVGVTKAQAGEVIRAAYEAGVRDFGENRVQEWEAKRPLVLDLDARWHMVGHLQSNKARRAIEAFHSIDSVDSLALAEKLNAMAKEMGRRLRVLMEVRTDPEASKSGVPEPNLANTAAAMIRLENLQLEGLMTVPAFLEDPEQVRPYFWRLARWREKLEKELGTTLPVLSMGMSHDFEVAVEEGATEVRIGTALFGVRA